MERPQGVTRRVRGPDQLLRPVELADGERAGQALPLFGEAVRLRLSPLRRRDDRAQRGHLRGLPLLRRLPAARLRREGDASLPGHRPGGRFGERSGRPGRLPQQRPDGAADRPTGPGAGAAAGQAEVSLGFGGQSMYAPLRRVVVRRPDPAFTDADPARWHYAGRPDLVAARAEHDAFVAILREAGAEVIDHEAPLPDHADAIYVHDPVLLTDRGAVLLRMGKPLRRGEEEALGGTLAAAGVPTRACLSGEACAEGGDLLWLDSQTLAVGLGFRTNREGLRQLSCILGPEIEILPVELPYYHGPDACLHLMSIISLVDDRLAVVYPPLLPVPFCEELRRREIQTVEVPEAEVSTIGCNVLALAPRDCLILE